MDWRDSEGSEEDIGHDQQTTSRKRSSRACDQCRKTKSKCERSSSGESAQCKSCALAGTACTFLGPSYKRGPPKGYIHAIEQRWHQVESLLGAILQCPDPRVQEFVNDIKQDELAREIINRVDMGPYGPAGRRSQPVGATKEDFFASILRSNGTSGRDTSRSRRQSRVSREIVSSSQDHGLSVVPTKEWQDNLSRRLATASRASASATSHYGDFRASTSNTSIPVTQRRRLNEPDDQSYQQDWNNMYTLSQEDSDDAKDATEAIGTLSLDENQEIRYHGRVSGLPFLGRNLRTDDRIEGGIWRLPMARVWPPARYGLSSPPTAEMDVLLPPWDVQDRLLELFFTYIHPVFPVIHKTQFFAEYHSRKHGTKRESPKVQESPRPDPSQEITPLLLLSIFTIAARFSEDEMPLPPSGKMWEAGCQYLDTARELLSKVLYSSRPSTVQSLLLLGYREFGIGSMEQGWIFIGMAIRMAFDLGLNCDSSKWKIHGHDLFSPPETQTRRQIWWSCILADRYGSIYMGRSTMIKDTDFDTPLPDIDPSEDNVLWQPIHNDNTAYSPTPGRVMSTFSALARLAVIAGDIITKVYPVKVTGRASKQVVRQDCEVQLDQWYLSLPDYLRYDASNRRNSTTPQILFLHVRYWGCVLLLYRAFIPNLKSPEEVARNSPVSSKALDLAQSAASHISTLVTVYRENFTLKRTSPFLTAYLLSSSIMHILTLSLRPTHVEATMGLRQCMTALKDMEVVWPSAARAWDLLNGVKLSEGVPMSQLFQPHRQSSDRQKRGADDAFGQEKNLDYPKQDIYDENTEGSQGGVQAENGVQDISTRIMAHMLGLDIPGIEPSTSYYPGYQWWPRSSGQGESSNQVISQPTSPPISAPGQMNINVANSQAPIGGPVNTSNIDAWTYPAVHPSRIPDSYSYDFSQFGP